MKARVKATGDIITITGVDGICLIDENGYYHLIRDLEGCEAMPDYWEKLKHQYAGMAMQQMVNYVNVGYEYVYEETATIALNFATALVNKLKEEEE